MNTLLNVNQECIDKGYENVRIIDDGTNEDRIKRFGKSDVSVCDYCPITLAGENAGLDKSFTTTPKAIYYQNNKITMSIELIEWVRIFDNTRKPSFYNYKIKDVKPIEIIIVDNYAEILHKENKQWL